jgi:hypothetical protein
MQLNLIIIRVTLLPLIPRQRPLPQTSRQFSVGPLTDLAASVKARCEDARDKGCRTVLQCTVSFALARKYKKCAAERAERNINELNYVRIYILDTMAFVHLIFAFGLVGAITHQGMAVALLVRKPTTGIITRFRAVPAAGYATAVCVLYVLTFFVGSFIYTQYRVAIRIPLEDEHY